MRSRTRNTAHHITTQHNTTQHNAPRKTTDPSKNMTPPSKQKHTRKQTSNTPPNTTHAHMVPTPPLSNFSTNSLTYVFDKEDRANTRKILWGKFGTLDNSEKTIAIPRGHADHKRRNRKGIKVSKKIFNGIDGENVMSAQTLEVSLLGVGTVLPSRKGCVVNGRMT